MGLIFPRKSALPLQGSNFTGVLQFSGMRFHYVDGKVHNDKGPAAAARHSVQALSPALGGLSRHQSRQSAANYHDISQTMLAQCSTERHLQACL